MLVTSAVKVHLRGYVQDSSRTSWASVLLEVSFIKGTFSSRLSFCETSGTFTFVLYGPDNTLKWMKTHHRSKGVKETADPVSSSLVLSFWGTSPVFLLCVMKHFVQDHPHAPTISPKLDTEVHFNWYIYKAFSNSMYTMHRAALHWNSLREERVYN